MKNLLLTLFALVALNMPAATVKYFTDYPNNASPPGYYAFPMDTGDHAPAGTPYAYISVDQFKALIYANIQLTGTVSITTFISTNFYSSNAFFTNITVLNLTAVTNNLYAITNSYTITTNIVIEQPGGFQNLNLTPSSLMASDALDNEKSVLNGTGALTNNGSGGFGWYKHFLPDLNGNGTNMNFYGVTTFNELDVTSGYFTNLFTFLTNAPYLATDGDGKVIATTTPSLTSATNEVTRQINSSTNIYAGLGTAISDLSLGTNLTYKYITNNSGSTTLNWGTAYRTNLAANVTIALQSVTTAANAPFYQSIVYWVTNSSGSDFKVTSPSGVIGPVGSGTPSALYCTNKTLTRLLFEHYGPSDITVSKTDYGN